MSNYCCFVVIWIIDFLFVAVRKLTLKINSSFVQVLFFRVVYKHRVSVWVKYPGWDCRFQLKEKFHSGYALGIILQGITGSQEDKWHFYTYLEIFESKLRLAEFYEIYFIISGVHFAVVLSAFWTQQKIPLFIEGYLVLSSLKYFWEDLSVTTLKNN